MPSSVLCVFLLLVLLGATVRANEDEEEACSCTERRLCISPHYKIVKESDCDDNTQVCCMRVEWSGVNCGKHADLRRILASHDTNPTEVPWTTVVTRERDPEEHQLLGAGSLIHPGVVLTAAHILEGVEDSTLRVRVGAYDLNPHSAEEFSESRGVVAIIRHPQFNANQLSNDIALLILSSPLTLGEKIKTLCLPSQGQSFDNSFCVFAGWGRDPKIDKSVIQAQLKRADMVVIPRRQCQDDLRRSSLFSPWLHLHSGFICTIGESPEQRPCKGDGGGPLFCFKDSEGTEDGYYEQAGVASWGASCKANVVTPSMFTGVAKYRDWIDDVLGRLSDGARKYKL